MPTSPATLTFSDDFDTLSLWNSSTDSGTWATNFWYADPKGNGSTLSGNGEQQWYINAEYAPTGSVKPWAVDNGVLTITARPAEAAIQPLINGYKYTSGEINSFHTFSQQYGYFEMRADLPAGQGAWPAFWLLPANGSWPPELDIVETLGHDTTTLYTTVHSNATGTHTSKGQGATVSDTAVGFHTYAVDWKADTITWYYDGVEVFSVATPADMHQPMYMVANLAVGGYWPGNVDASTPIPLEMKIDYIHVYSSKPEGIAPPPPAPVDPNASLTLTANDKSAAALTGGANADILTAAHLANSLTGGGGADTFVFKVLPWNAGHITDFTVGIDKLDFSGLIAASGYTGSDLVADGYLSIVSDGHGGSKLLFDMDGKGAGNPWATTIVTLDGVSPQGLTTGQLFGSAPAPAAPSAQAPVTTPSATPSVSAPTPTVVNLQGSNLVPSVLTGGAGADTLLGGQLDDSLEGLAGDDRLDGNDGSDLIAGGDGFDRINGNSGNDTVRGGAGADWVHGGKSADQVFGDDGNDFVYGNIGNDIVYGGAGADIVRGGQDNDVLSGDAGDDWLSGDRGSDNLTGGAGSDIFYSFAGAGLDLITDFNRAEGDRIQLDVGQTHSVYQSGTDAIIDLGGGDQIILAGVNISALSGDWLIGG